MRGMNLFKAHFIHPYTQTPLIIYFNKSEGHVTFETDQEMIKMIINIEKQWSEDRELLQQLREPPNICKTQYPVRTFSEVYELLERLGISKEELEFKQIHVH